jgi:hypothetical protein
MPVKKTTTAAGDGKSKSLESGIWQVIEKGAPDAGIQPIGDSARPNPASKPQDMPEGRNKLVRFVAHAA